MYTHTKPAHLIRENQDQKLKRNNLFIKEMVVNAGPTLKRWQPRAFGRATPLRKRSSHIEVILEEKVPTSPEKVVKIKPEKKNDDIIKIDDFEEIKQADKKSKDKEIKHNISDHRGNRSGKGFMGKVFNRKSGDK